MKKDKGLKEKIENTKFDFYIGMERLNDHCLFIDRHISLTMKQEEKLVSYLRKLDK